MDLPFPWDITGEEFETLSRDQYRNCDNCTHRLHCVDKRNYPSLDCCGSHEFKHGYEQLTLF